MADSQSKPAHTTRNRAILDKVQHNLLHPPMDTSGPKAFLERKQAENARIEARPGFGRRDTPDDRTNVSDVPQANAPAQT